MTAEAGPADAGAAGALATISAQRRAWEARPLVRALYTDWFERISERLSSVPGETVELGAGSGGFKEFMPDALATDIVETPWTDRRADAEHLPFADASIANVVMVDVLHHLPDPATALREMARTLAPGGRVVMVEPFCSPLSGPFYRHLHHEGADPKADLESGSQSSDDPFDANNALPTLLFWKHRGLAERWAPELRVVERQRFGWLAYPLSGGFTKPQLLPGRLLRPALALERLLGPVLSPLAAFRCLVVMERR